MSSTAGLAAELVETARELGRLGLNRGSTGNVSVRCDEGALITPSGVAFDRLSAETVVRLDEAGDWSGPLQPSSEWRFHLAIHRARPEVSAVVHTHSDYATALACTGRGIPAFHYMVAVAGGDSIRCAPYAPFGSGRLADLVVDALDDRRACLLAHHGVVAVGGTLRAALDLAVEVESLARQYCQVLQLGEPKLLSAEQMADVLARFASYGEASPRG